MVRLRAAVSLVLVLALSSPALAGAGGRKAPLPEKPPEFSLLDAASSFWSGIAKLWEKEGSSIDPLGKPAPPPSGTTSTGTGGLEPRGISIIPE